MKQMVNNPVPGNLKISEEVISAIVTQAAVEVEGVYGLSDIPISMKEYILLAKKPRAIKIAMNGGTAGITVGLCLRSGYKIKRIAEQVQQEVKAAVQSMTGVTVSKVNIYVAGVKNEQRSV